MIRKFLLTAAAIFVGKKLMQRIRSAPTPEQATNGHAAMDHVAAPHPHLSKRAAEPFRPDPHSPVAPEDREALRPAMPVAGD